MIICVSFISQYISRFIRLNFFCFFYKTLAPKIKQLNTDIQNCYKIKKRTILWKQEYDKVMEKEQERKKQNELKQSKKKSKKYLR